MALKPKEKQKIIAKFKIHDKDTGSTEVQVALLTEEILRLTEHLKENPKDNHSRRGLLAMVANRQAHMKYLEKKNPRRAHALQKKLGLKK